MWPFKPKQFLGVDIGTSSVKLVELSKKGKQIKLDTYGEFKAANYVEHSQATSNLKQPYRLTDQQIANITRLVIKESGAKSKHVTFSLPALSTFTTVFSVPEMTRKELAQSIPYEAKQYVPLPLSEVILDWHIIGKKEMSAPDGALKGPASAPGAAQLEIFVAAFPKEMVNRFSRIAKLAGLELRALELETFSLIRSSVEATKNPVAVIDLGANASNISIVKDKFIHMTHNFDISGATITSTLSSALQIDSRRAEQMKMQQGLLGQSGEAEISNIITPLVDLILSESDRILESYARKTGTKVAKIVLSGGTANLPGLVDRFVQHFKIETTISNPFLRIAHPSVIAGVLKEIGPDFAIATGLAMRELS